MHTTNTCKHTHTFFNTPSKNSTIKNNTNHNSNNSSIINNLPLCPFRPFGP